MSLSSGKIGIVAFLKIETANEDSVWEKTNFLLKINKLLFLSCCFQNSRVSASTKYKTLMNEKWMKQPVHIVVLRVIEKKVVIIYDQWLLLIFLEKNYDLVILKSSSFFSLIGDVGVALCCFCAANVCVAENVGTFLVKGENVFHLA